MPSPADEFAAMPSQQRQEFLETLTKSQCEHLMYNWREFLARPNQIAPDGDWDIWMVLAGRGFGKTRIGAEWVREQIANGVRKIALVGETASDVRTVMVEGESGILNIYPPNERPRYEPSKRQITWQNGAIARLYNATEPDQLRGPQHEIAWCDELAKWDYARDAWDQLQFGLRVGNRPRQVITTTPRPKELIVSIINGKEGKVSITRGNTFDNEKNLAPAFIEKIRSRYEGTRIGRQEIEGEILADIPGALWRLEQIDSHRCRSAPDILDRIVVSVDPAVSSGETSDEHGIVVVGVSGQSGYLLEDASLRGSPLSWARQAIVLYDKYGADGIVVEVNQGGEMVSQTLRSVRSGINIIEVRASRGKHVRAEPIAALYEQGRIHHIGSFPELESQMTLMTASGYQGDNSPDRLDSLVWGLSVLFPDIVRSTPIRTPEYRLNPVV